MGDDQHGKSYFQELLGSVVYAGCQGWRIVPKWESERGDEITWKLVLPDSLKKEVLRQLQDNPAAGHLGFKKTTERVRTRFYWCGLCKDVESWCVQCDVCASRKKLKNSKGTNEDLQCRGPYGKDCD